MKRGCDIAYFTYHYAAGVDYDLPATTLEFSSSVSSHTVTIGIIDDNFNEYEERFDVFIADVSVKNASGTELPLSAEERNRIRNEGSVTIVIRDSKFEM